MLRADCRLYTHKAASVEGKQKFSVKAPVDTCIAQLSERGCPGAAPNYKLCPTQAMATRFLQVRSRDHENPRGDTPELTPEELESSILPHYWVRQAEKHDVQCHKELQQVPKQLPLDARLPPSPSKVMPRLLRAINSNGVLAK